MRPKPSRCSGSAPPETLGVVLQRSDAMTTMGRTVVSVFLFLFLGGCAPGQQVEEREPEVAERPNDPPGTAPVETTWDSAEWARRISEAEQAMVMLSPASFPDVPAVVRGEFESMGCQVPQVHGLDEAHNLIKGHFASKDQEDWAVLCSLADSTHIVVLWGGPSRCPSPIEGSLDREWFQGVGSGALGYSRKIGTASMSAILRHAEEFDGPPPPAEDHDGIDHYFYGKASVVLFCHEGEWHRLQGID